MNCYRSLLLQKVVRRRGYQIVLSWLFSVCSSHPAVFERTDSAQREARPSTEREAVESDARRRTDEREDRSGQPCFRFWSSDVLHVRNHVSKFSAELVHQVEKIVTSVGDFIFRLQSICEFRCVVFEFRNSKFELEKCDCFLKLHLAERDLGVQVIFPQKINKYYII